MRREVQTLLDELGVVVSARTRSVRLPGKALLPLGGVPMVLFLLRRLAESSQSGLTVLATTSLNSDDILASVVGDEGFSVVRGDADCLISRYIQAAKAHSLSHIVRVTADCPFVDAESLDYFVKETMSRPPSDLFSTKGKFPKGIDFELFATSSLYSLLAKKDLSSHDREHLTHYFYRSPGSTISYVSPPEAWNSTSYFTIDTPLDYARAIGTVQKLGNRIDFSISDLVGVS